jgi:hypothetical protein
MARKMKSIFTSRPDVGAAGLMHLASHHSHHPNCMEFTIRMLIGDRNRVSTRNHILHCSINGSAVGTHAGRGLSGEMLFAAQG